MKDWYKPKAFTHLTPKLTFKDRGRIEQYISNPENISTHNFFPLIHRTIVTKRLKRGKDKNGNEIKKHFFYKGGKRESTAKYREIYYPTHLDAHIYSYYSQNVLGPLYEMELGKNPILDQSIVAYRKIPISDGSRCKCNIDFANEAFEEIGKSKGEVAVIALDISKFFDSLDHKKLKKAWCRLLGRNNLEKDHYSIFKSLTQFSYVELSSLLKEFEYKHPNDLIQKNVACFVNNGDEFREKIKAKGYLKKNPFRREGLEGKKVPIGIPQGTPISAFLANLYLFEFDQKLLEIIGTNSVYRRYSDDLLIICPREQYEAIAEKIYCLIKEFDLIIQPSKTQVSYFINGKLEKGQKPVVYLGFQFDGINKRIKSASLAKFYRKLKRNIKYRAYRALEAKRKCERGRLVNATIFRKKLYEQFSFLGGRDRRKTKRSFFSYVYFANEVMQSPHILKQLAKSWAILHNEISKYEERYSLPKIK
jgi:hypothetical protein